MRDYSQVNSSVRIHIFQFLIIQIQQFTSLAELNHVFTAENAVEVEDSHSQWEKTCPNKEYYEAREAEAVPATDEKSAIDNSLIL